MMKEGWKKGETKILNIGGKKYGFDWRSIGLCVGSFGWGKLRSKKGGVKGDVLYEVEGEVGGLYSVRRG